MGTSSNREIDTSGRTKQAKRAPTVSDVARLANDSVGTVSNVLSENKAVSARRTRPEVEAAQMVGYRPNRLARALVVQRETVHRASAKGSPWP